MRHLAVAEHLHRAAVRPLDEPRLHAGCRDRPRCPAANARQVAEVHDGVLGLAAVGQEAALGQPPIERHLAALEAAGPCRRPSGPCCPLRPLVGRSCRGRSRARGRPACALLGRPGRGPEILKPHALTLSTCGALRSSRGSVAVSSCITVCRIRARSPRALTVASCFGLQPDDALHERDPKLLAATGRLLLPRRRPPLRRRAACRSCSRLIRRSASMVALSTLCGIVGPQRLREDVLHPRRLQHRPHGAARDDAGALGRPASGRRAARPEVPGDLAGDRRVA